MLLVIAVGLAGLALMALGVRGRRIDDHPICRKCGYDLHGHADLPQCCSECGRDLRKPNRVRIGHRRRGWVVFTLGVFLLGGFLTSTGVVAWATAKGYDWTEHKPLWLLRRTAENPTQTKATRAQQEILRRIAVGKLSRNTIRSMLDDFLEVDDDPGRNWQPWWSEFVATARATGDLTDGDMARVVLGQIEIELDAAVSPHVRQGSEFHFRILSGKDLTWGITLPQRANLKLKPVGILTDGPRRGVMDADGRSYVGFATADQLELGPQQLRCQLSVVIESPLPHPLAATAPSAGGRVRTFSFPVVIPSGATIVAATEPIVQLVPNSGVRAAILSAITVHRLVLGVDRGRVVNAQLSFHLNRVPVDYAFEVFARIGDREWLVADIAHGRNWFAPRGRRNLYIANVDVFPGDVERVDLVFRPSIRAAEELLETDQIWDGELLMQNVPVTRVPVPSGR